MPIVQKMLGIRIVKLLWQDLFGGRSLASMALLTCSSSLPFILEFEGPGEAWLLDLASRTGIVLVAEGRPNYLFGAVNSALSYIVLQG